MTRFARNLIHVYGGNALNGVLGIASVPVLVALLGIEGYGIYAIYPIVYSIITLAESGFTKNLVRLLAGSSTDTERVAHLNAAFGFYALLSALLLLALPLAAWLVPTGMFDLEPRHTAAAAIIVTIAIVEYIVAIPPVTLVWNAAAAERFTQVARFNVISGLYRYAFLLLGALLLRTPEGAVAFAAARRLVDYAVAPRVLGGLPRGAWRASFDAVRLRALVAAAVPMTAAQTGATLVITLPAVLASRYFGAAGLGAFRAIYDLSSRVWFLSVGAGFVVFPKLVREMGAGAASAERRARMASALQGSWLVYAALAIIGTTATPFIADWIGPHMTDVLWAFPLVLAGTCLNAHAQASFEFLQAARRTWLLVGIVAVTLAALAIGAVTFSAYGFLALGGAWLASQLLYALASDALTLGTLGTSTRTQLGAAAMKLAGAGVVVLCAALLVAGVWYWPAPAVLWLAGSAGYAARLYREAVGPPAIAGALS